MVFGIGETSIAIVIKAKDMFSKTFSEASFSIAKFQKAALGAAAVGVGIAVAFGKAINETIDLETAMVGVAKTTGLANDEIEVLRKDFIELSKEIPLSAEELAKVGEVAGQLGITGRNKIRDFTVVVSKMSIATELTAESAALALAKISNAMGLPIEEADKLSSAINELSNISAASSSEIVSAMVRVAGSAKTLGLSTDVVSGLTAALINAGEPAERAGTKLRSAFDTVVKKIDEVEQFMPGFSDALRKDANGAIISLIGNLNKIEDPITRQKTAIDLFGTVGASAINKLSNDIPGMNKLIEAATGQFENATSTQEEFDKAVESTKNQIQLAKNEFTALALEIGSQLIPIIRDVLLPIFKKVVDFFSNLSKPVKQALIILGLVTMAVTLLAGAIALVTLVSSPWLLIIGGIILAITAIILIIMNWKKILLTLVSLTLKGASLMDKAWEGLKDGFIIAFEIMKNVVISVWNFIVNFVEGQINTLISAINFLIKGLNKIPKVNISLIPEIDFSAVKGQLTDIDTLKQSLALEREASAEKFTKASNQVIVNIGNVNGMDPEEISKALHTELNNKISL